MNDIVRPLFIGSIAFIAASMCGCGGDGDSPRSDAGLDGSVGSGCSERVGGSIGVAHVLRFENEGEAIVVHVAREYVEHGVGHSSIFRLSRMRIERGGSCHIITEAADLDYENSHHNWRDIAHARVGDLEYILRLTFDISPGVGDWRITLEAIDEGGTFVLEPVELLTTGGPLDDWSGPGWLPVFVNELMPVNTSTWQDEAGEHDPWIELYNPSPQSKDIGGYFLSNDPENPRLWSIPSGTTIDRHGFLIVPADGQTGQGALHTSFRLSADGGAVRLSAPDIQSTGERYYGPLDADQSFEYDWRTGFYQATDRPTPGAVNDVIDE